MIDAIKLDKVKLICSDIDGTLLNHDRELSSATIAALSHVGRRIPIVLISSRMPRAMTHLQRELGIEHHPLIAYNGGLVISQEGEIAERLLSVEIDIQDVMQIRTYAEDTSVHISLYHGDEWYVPADDYWAAREQRNTKVKPTVESGSSVCERWAREGKGAHKIMCMGDAEEIEILYQRLQDALGDQLHLYRSKDTYIEIASSSISKLSGLAFLLDARYDIDLCDVMAFGDNYNDVEMIGGVGYGVAVANARPEALAVASYVTTTGKEDGVAAVVRQMMT